MARELRTRTFLLGMPALTILACTSCLYIHGYHTMARYEREAPLSAPLEPGSAFSAKTGDGSITIEGGQTNECTLQATIVTHATTAERARELAEQIDVRLEPAARGLQVVIHRPSVIHHARFSVSLRGVVPTQTDLSLSTGDGAINIANITGIVEARTSDGSIETQDIDGDMKLRTSDGGITCARLKAGALECHTADGGIRLSDVTAGSLAAQTSDGGITLEAIRADSATARTNDGSIHWREAVVGRIECHSSDGTIHIEYAADAPKALHLNATVADGSITLVGPPQMSAEIDAATHDGSIRTDLPLTIRGKVGKSLRGTIGGGEGRIYLRTSDGSIAIR